MKQKKNKDLKIFKPTSPGIRGKINVNRTLLSKRRPFKALTKCVKRTGGRNFHGKLTDRKKGRGVKRLYRKINLTYQNLEEYSILTKEYDPNRSAWISLVENPKDNKKHYILTPNDVEVGKIISENQRSFGSRIQLNKLKTGDWGFALSPNKWGVSQIGRAAGTQVQLVSWTPKGKAVMKLPSGELKEFSEDAYLTFGRSSNLFHKNRVLSKAGTAARLNRRPITRGMAQGAYAHPMGKKAGSTKGRVPKTLWGKIAKGVKTRNKRKNSNKLILKRRGSGKK